MKINYALPALISFILIFSCNQKKSEPVSGNSNPPMEGFDLLNSDPAAVELADSIMKAIGGRANWDNTRFISWKFGSRNLVWDKYSGRVRVEAPKDSIIYLTNINTDEGKVQVKGQELTQPDSLKKMLQN